MNYQQINIKNPFGNGITTITVVYLLTFILMLPLKNVAFFDDFAYIRTVERLHQTGELKLSDWTTVAMVFQSYWALIFTKIFGFSIKILHLSNVVLFYIGLVFFYHLLKRLAISKEKAIFFTLFLLGFPWSFQFIYTFMSDTFYIPLSIITIYFYVRGLQASSHFSLLLGGFFAGLTFLTRQIGVSLPLAILCIYIYIAIFQKKFLWKEILTSQFFFIICIGIYIYRLNLSGPTAAYLYHVTQNVQKSILPYLLPLNLGQVRATNSLYIESMIQRGLGYFCTMMVFFLPIFLCFRLKAREILRFLQRNKRLVLAVTLITLSCFYIDNIFNTKFSSNYSAEILIHDKNFFDWPILWKKLIWASIPIWIGILSLFIYKINSTFFEYKKIRSGQKFYNLLCIYILCLIGSFFYIYKSIYPRIFVLNYSDLNYSIPILFNSIFTEYFISAISESWFFLSLIFTLLTSITYFFIYKRIRKLDHSKSVLLFLLLTFSFQLFMMLFFAFFYWPQYILQILPILIIFISLVYKTSKLNKYIAGALILLLLFFSLSITRYRYHVEGNKWELATKLVIEKDVNPYNISAPNWAWRPYWFFESLFAEEIEKAGGDKLKAAKNNLQPWFKGDPSGENYEVLLIDQKYSPKNVQILYESDNFWVFVDRQFVQRKVILFPLTQTINP